MMRSRARRLAIALLPVAILLAACGGGESEPTGGSSAQPTAGPSVPTSDPSDPGRTLLPVAKACAERDIVGGDGGQQDEKIAAHTELAMVMTQEGTAVVIHRGRFLAVHKDDLRPCEFEYGQRRDPAIPDERCLKSGTWYASGPPNAVDLSETQLVEVGSQGAKVRYLATQVVMPTDERIAAVYVPEAGGFGVVPLDALDPCAATGSPTGA